MIDTQKIAGYQILKTLGRNTSGGRITYLAQKCDRQVILKQFQFATSGSDWSGWKALEREVDILKGLQHPKIPRYIESIELDSGFFLVQEYIPAESLAVKQPRSLACTSTAAKRPNAIANSRLSGREAWCCGPLRLRHREVGLGRSIDHPGLRESDAQSLSGKNWQRGRVTSERWSIWLYSK